MNTILIVAVLFVGYKLEKTLELLADWKDEWSSVAGFKRMEDPDM